MDEILWIAQNWAFTSNRLYDPHETAASIASEKD